MLNKFKGIFIKLHNTKLKDIFSDNSDKVAESIEEARQKIKEGEERIRKQVAYVDSITPPKEFGDFLTETLEWMKKDLEDED